MKIKWYKSGKFHKEEILDLPKNIYTFKKEVIDSHLGKLTFYTIHNKNNYTLCDIYPLKFKSSGLSGKMVSISDEDIKLIKSGDVLIDIGHARIKWNNLIEIISEEELSFE